MKKCIGVEVKPSPYFADRFRYFFKRFYSPEKLYRWFLTQAGEDSGEFNFPAALQGNPKTVVFLARDVDKSTAFLKAMPDSFFKNTILCAPEATQVLVSAKHAKAIYYTDLECRFGEAAFDELLYKIKDFKPEVCIYLGEAFWPTLYLAKVCGANCRIGFADEHCYPFLNICLHPNKMSEAALISQYYGVK